MAGAEGVSGTTWGRSERMAREGTAAARAETAPHPHDDRKPDNRDPGPELRVLHGRRLRPDRRGERGYRQNGRGETHQLVF